MTDSGNADSASSAWAAPFYVDGCLVLPALNRIRRGEETVHVEPRVMMVLVCLADRPGEVLSREYLFGTVWPGAVVCEEALTRTISELRRLFHDDAKSPRVIETIRKGGYRLVAPVSPAAESDLPQPSRARSAGPSVEISSPPRDSSPARGGGSPDRAEAPQPSLRTGTEPCSIADWLVEPERGRLTRDRDVVRLEPRVMQVLTYLAARPGEVVSRSSLLKAIWPEGEIHETNLTSAISDLRRVFEDAPDKPRYIETIRGVGYRLVAPVRPSPGSSGRAAAAAARGPFRSARTRARLLGAAGLAAAVLTLVLFWGGYGPGRMSREWRIRPLTVYPGTEYTPALSPDGSMLVFSWQGENADEGSLLDLYVMQVENGKPVRLTADTGHEFLPTWSPDGTTIAFACGVADSFEICTVPLLGEGRRKLMAVGSPVAGLDWSPDGTYIAYSAHADSSTSYRIHLLELDTMKSSLLDVPQLYGDDVSPAFSPDGKALAFIREENFNQQRVLHTYLGSGEVEELSGVGQRVAGLDWVSDHELVLSASNLVDYDLWLADLHSGRRTWVTTRGGPAISPTTARGGSRIVYGELAYECNIWSVGVEAGGEIRQSADPLIASTRVDYNPVCSPDGESIAFLSDRSGHMEMWIADATGKNPWQLTEEIGSYLMNPRWSPDSRRLAYSAMSADHLRVFVSEVETRVASRLSASDRHELLLNWSSSGEWLYYRVQRDDAWEVWRRRPDGSHEEQVTETGYTVFGETAGADLLCWKDGHPGIWRMPAGGGEARLVVSGDATKSWTGVAVAENGLFFIRREVATACLGFYDWASSREDSLASIPLDSGMLVISPDRARLLYDCTTKFEIDLMLAEVVP
jgi:DNA-binding winged helix-turn-helix (wHTH) protein/Tol biopolymer transport system component